MGSDSRGGPELGWGEIGKEGLAGAAIVLTGAYLAAQMLADLGSLKITAFWGITMDAGTLVYPIPFTLRDLIHKRLGIRAARITIVAAAAINLVMAGFFWLVAILPPDPAWASQSVLVPSMQDAFSAILSPAWIIVIASILAELVSELVDTEAYRVFTARAGKRHQWARVLVSNAFSLPLDSLVFCWIAFGPLGFRYEAATVWAIFWANVGLKAAISLVSLPMIYLVREGRGGGREPTSA